MGRTHSGRLGRASGRLRLNVNGTGGTQLAVSTGRHVARRYQQATPTAIGIAQRFAAAAEAEPSDRRITLRLASRPLAIECSKS